MSIAAAIIRPARLIVNAQTLQGHLIHQVFARTFAGDPELIDAIGRFDGELRCVDGDLLFTLPHLFRFLVADFEQRRGCAALADDDRDYRRFRRMLYRSDTNAALRRIGAVVVIDRADPDHSLRRYRLTRYSA